MQPMDPISGKLNDSAAPSEDEVAVSLNFPVSKFPIIENVYGHAGSSNQVVVNHTDFIIRSY